MTWRENYIAVDWGTTNRRAWLVDPAGKVICEFEDTMGLTSVPENGFDSAVAEIRQKLGPCPMLLAGMVGSDRGWRNVPYIRCPTNLRALGQGIMWIDPHFTGIVPGVSQTVGHADVMRGEEVQALGAIAGGFTLPDALVCHPGTHTKWIRLEGGEIVDFRTSMTGEMFDLLSNHSLLATQMQTSVSDNDSFQAGLDKGLNNAPLLSELFAIRAQHLLFTNVVEGASFASGLLIGTDVKSGLSLANNNEKINVIGRSDLCRLYTKAIVQSGYQSVIVDGESAFLAGIHSIISSFAAGPEQ